MIPSFHIYMEWNCFTHATIWHSVLTILASKLTIFHLCRSATRGNVTKKRLYIHFSSIRCHSIPRKSVWKSFNWTVKTSFQHINASPQQRLLRRGFFCHMRRCRCNRLMNWTGMRIEWRVVKLPSNRDRRW